MKLNINKYYTLYTTSNYIQNTKVKVLGYIGYDRASQYQSMIENVAINEKFITNTGDTMSYLKKQIYYDCAVVEITNGEIKITDKHIVVWDDIINSELTQRLNEDYVYKLTFKFKNTETGDNITKDKVVAAITTAVKNNFNNDVEKVELELTEIIDDSLDDITNKLNTTEAILDGAIETIQAFISLRDSAKQINSEFSENNINTKVNNIGSKLESIETSLNTIIASLK